MARELALIRGRAQRGDGLTLGAESRRVQAFLVGADSQWPQSGRQMCEIAVIRPGAAQLKSNCLSGGTSQCEMAALEAFVSALSGSTVASARGCRDRGREIDRRGAGWFRGPEEARQGQGERHGGDFDMHLAHSCSVVRNSERPVPRTGNTPFGVGARKTCRDADGDLRAVLMRTIGRAV